MLCCVLLLACQGKQPCVGDNDDWLRVPQSRVSHIADVSSQGVCTVASAPTPCDAGGCLYTADGGITAQFVVTGNAPGACTVSVTYTDGSPPEDAEFTFVTGPIQYCCEALCAKMVGALHPRE